MSKSQEQGKKNSGSTLLLILGCLLPLIIIFVLAGLGFRISPRVFILILFLCPLILSRLIGYSEKGEEKEGTEPSKEDTVKEVAEQPSNIKAQTASIIKTMEDLFSWNVFFVNRTSTVGDALIFEGNLRAEPAIALDILTGRFKEKFGNKYQLFLQQDSDEKPVIVVVPTNEAAIGEKAKVASNPLINILLFLATIVTTTMAGASHQGVNLFSEPSKFTIGLPYAFGIMAILGIHELGHYIFSRRHGIVTTFPYFIPIPFGLGTFGALIQMKSLVRDRKALFDTGIAGPIAGLIVAIPILFIGLKYSGSSRKSVGKLMRKRSIGRLQIKGKGLFCD